MQDTVTFSSNIRLHVYHISSLTLFRSDGNKLHKDKVLLYVQSNHNLQRLVIVSIMYSKI